MKQQIRVLQIVSYFGEYNSNVVLQNKISLKMVKRAKHSFIALIK